MKKQNPHGRANIINFIRFDHGMTTVEGEMQAIISRGLPATWLLQYDALAMGPYVAYLKANMPSNHEVGLWFEVNRKHCQDAGVAFRGEIPAPGNTQDTENWDHHSQAMMSCGYSQKDRIRLIDTMMEKFKAVWGRYPASVCAWYIDSFSLKYLADKYQILASANCREQWGTDGYSLWGAPVHGFYYPSVTNAMAPACSPDKQINVPVFRMLGVDPVNYHDAKIETNGQPVYTLEPAYAGGGGNPEWVRRFFDMCLGPATRPFAYFQVGQENSFPWEQMKAGFCFQLDELIQREKAGKLIVETLSATGRFVKETYKETPIGVLDANDNLLGGDLRTIWYHSPHYRAMIAYSAHRFEIVDLYRYLPTDVESHYEEPLNNWTGIFMPLPMIDSFLFGSRWFLAGKTADGRPFDERNIGIRDVQIGIENDTLSVTYANEIGIRSEIHFQPTGIHIDRRSASPVGTRETLAFDRLAKFSPIQGVYRNHVVFGWHNNDYRLTVKECLPCIDYGDGSILLGACDHATAASLSLILAPCRPEAGD